MSNIIYTLTAIISGVMGIFSHIRLLGIPILYWEFFLGLIAIVVRILFGPLRPAPSSPTAEDLPYTNNPNLMLRGKVSKIFKRKSKK